MPDSTNPINALAVHEARASWEYRDPAVARSYALYAPGGGHLYAGETVKGALLLATPIVAVWTGISRVGSADCSGSGMVITRFITCAPLHFAAAAGAYVYGIIDSKSSADRMNNRRGLVASVQPSAGLDGGVGLVLQFRF